jgi:hypothetical protein
MGDCKNLQEIEISQLHFKTPANLAAIFCPGLVCPLKPWEINFLHIFAVPFSSRHETAVKYWKDFYFYFTTLETYCEFELKLF